jgi:hypothetical protein
MPAKKKTPPAAAAPAVEPTPAAVEQAAPPAVEPAAPPAVDPVDTLAADTEKLCLTTKLHPTYGALALGMPASVIDRIAIKLNKETISPSEPPATPEALEAATGLIATLVAAYEQKRARARITSAARREAKKMESSVLDIETLEPVAVA